MLKRVKIFFFFFAQLQRGYINVSITSVRVDEEAGEGTVFVGVSAMNFTPV